jgi:uncharacterized protein (DUF2252 family)
MTSLDKIKAFNAGRDEQLLLRKYDRMMEGVFRFFRATSHLFFEDLKEHFTTQDPTRVWGCGDLHLQNFGTYKADNRLVYFDLNDFDDGQLMPATWELARMLVSIHLAAEELALNKRECDALTVAFLESYNQTLILGKPIDIERRTAKGMLKNFIENLESRKRKQFIKSRTVEVKKTLKLKVDNDKVLPIVPEKRQMVEQLLTAWLKQHPNPFFKRVLDVAVRVTGGASLGLERYIVLVENHKEKRYLLDLKEARPSTLTDLNPLSQPAWPTEADRIVHIQNRVNNVLPTLLNALLTDVSKSFVLKELQPEQDKFDYNYWDGEMDSLEDLLRTMAQITASGHLRSSGRQGSSITDDLIAFAHETTWQKDLLHYCAQYPQKVHRDYFIFCEAYEEGIF